MTTPTEDLDPSELDLEQQFGQCAPRDPMGVQYGAADSADFSEGTWSFKMHGDWKVAAGEFAIVPRVEFSAQVSAQAKALQAMAPAIRNARTTLLIAAGAVPNGALKNRYIQAANGLLEFTVEPSELPPLTCSRSRRSDCALFDPQANKDFYERLLSPEFLAAEDAAGGVLAAGGLDKAPAVAGEAATVSHTGDRDIDTANLLEECATMLTDYALHQRDLGNDSTAAGADAHAYRLRRLNVAQPQPLLASEAATGVDVLRLVAAARAVYAHRYQMGAPMLGIYDELKSAAEAAALQPRPVAEPRSLVLWGSKAEPAEPQAQGILSEYREALEEGQAGAARLIWQSIQRGPGAQPDWALKEVNRPGGFYWNDGVSIVHTNLAELVDHDAASASKE
ncbi:MAG: hypothetical protein LCH79_16600 [Proteobacteria bacterium]|nr:hypothetical protein [Pseudomonadota bacterium]